MLGWWSSELAAMMPATARRAVGLDRDILLLCLSDGRLEVRRRGSSGERQLASMAWHDRDQADPAAMLRDPLAELDAQKVRVELVVDAELTLRRTLHVPRAAEAEIRGVLSFEIERHTPFRDHEIYFDHVIDREASNDATVTANLVIVPRRIVDPVIRGLRELGFDLDRVVVSPAAGAAGDETVTIPVEGVVKRRHRGNNAIKLWATLTIVLAVAAATMPLIRLMSLSETLAVAVQQAEAEAETTRSLQDEVDRLSRGMNVIARAKAEASSPLAILQDLSHLLPDGTWVVQFSIVGDEVILEGRTDSSARLVGLLEASPLFESVKYLAPVTRDAREGLERFNFSLRLAPG